MDSSNINKPQIASSSQTATDTIVNSTQQDVKQAKPTPSVRSLNQYGITVMRGGNVIGSSLLDSIIDAYTNLMSYQPIATVLFVLAIVYYSTLIIDKPKSSPFLLMHASILTTHTNATGPLIKSLASFSSTITSILKTYDSFVGLICAMGFPYLSKPSTRNAILSTILILYSLLGGLKPLPIIMLSQMFFLLVQLRSPKHKAIIVIIAIVTIIINHEYMADLAGIKK